MAILNKIYSGLALLVLSGCYSDFTPDVNTEPVLCINSLITAGKPIELQITHTWMYTDTEGELNNSVDDAVTTIYANGTRVDSDYLPQEGDHIRISASSRRYGNAEAEVRVPVSVPISDLTFSSRLISVGQIEYNDYIIADITFNIDIKLSIDDPSRTTNYFHYECSPFISEDDAGSGENEYGVPFAPNYINTGNFQYDAEPIFAEHIGVLESVSGSDAYGFTFFTDRQFSGQRYSLNLQYSGANAHINTTTDNLNQAIDCGFTVTIGSISESYYNWANYCWQIDSGLLGDLGSSGLGDPLWSYSNVSTGAGIVVAQSIRSAEINLSEFINTALLQQPVNRNFKLCNPQEKVKHN